MHQKGAARPQSAPSAPNQGRHPTPGEAIGLTSAVATDDGSESFAAPWRAFALAPFRSRGLEARAELGTAMDAKLLVDALRQRADGVLAQPELTRDLRTRLPGVKRPRNL